MRLPIPFAPKPAFLLPPESRVLALQCRRFQRFKSGSGIIIPALRCSAAAPACNSSTAKSPPESGSPASRPISYKFVPVLRVENRLGHCKMRARVNLRQESLDLNVPDRPPRIHSDADREIRRATQSFS